MKVVPLPIMIELTSLVVIFKALQSDYVSNPNLKRNVNQRTVILKPLSSTTCYSLNGALCRAIDSYNGLPASDKAASDYLTFRKDALNLIMKFYSCL